MPTLESGAAHRADGAKPGRSKRTVRKTPAQRAFWILSVSASADDHRALRHILRDAPCHISVASTLSNAIGRLSRGKAPSIVVCESQLPDGTWKDMFHQIAQCTEPSILIVTSRLADEHLWAEVLNLGAYDVLSKPFSEREVRHVLGSAWERRESAMRVHAAGV